MKMDGVVLFHTSSAALRAEKLCQRAHLVVKLIPTPRELSSDCGIALGFPWDQVEQVKTQLDAGHVEIDSIHSMTQMHRVLT